MGVTTIKRLLAENYYLILLILMMHYFAGIAKICSCSKFWLTSLMKINSNKLAIENWLARKKKILSSNAALTTASASQCFSKK